MYFVKIVNGSFVSKWRVFESAFETVFFYLISIAFLCLACLPCWSTPHLHSAGHMTQPMGRPHAHVPRSLSPWFHGSTSSPCGRNCYDFVGVTARNVKFRYFNCTTSLLNFIIVVSIVWLILRNYDDFLLLLPILTSKR